MLLTEVGWWKHFFHLLGTILDTNYLLEHVCELTHLLGGEISKKIRVRFITWYTFAWLWRGWGATKWKGYKSIHTIDHRSFVGKIWQFTLFKIGMFGMTSKPRLKKVTKLLSCQTAHPPCTQKQMYIYEYVCIYILKILDSSKCGDLFCPSWV